MATIRKLRGRRQAQVRRRRRSIAICVVDKNDYPLQKSQNL